ncbi:hypothetical protein N7455_012565 [Penicillium solitum]|uniref:uncharacterized protein n=1 Tax=Penicillium solitum TaxID=60172 RepID=UPI0032C490CF|nr:hypothetical protein N7455_012565 [Penicillium solitum]
MRAPCIAGRATTWWKAHQRDEEGELLQEATERGVVNVARYYHHSTVYIRDEIDDVQDNVRGGLDIKTASNYRPEHLGERLALSSGTSMASAPYKGQSSGRSGVKRSASQTGASLPPNKRLYSASPTKASSSPLPNRIHRRVVLRDYGKPIYKASSLPALLAALKGCVTGHKSLEQAGILHRDISVNNIMINEDKENPPWPSFLIDLDLALREQRVDVSGATGKTGIRAFMAIGVLLGEKHSFMHDLESFFSVLFWICIHEAPDKGRVVTEFDQWNFGARMMLATSKKGVISGEVDFVMTAKDYFTEYYQPLIPCVNTLRKAVFPNGRRRAQEDTVLYDQIKEILRGAREA